MKLNFRKVVPVIAGALLLGSTLGFATGVTGASLSYPDDFNDAVIVYGAQAATSDFNAAMLLSEGLSSVIADSSVSGESHKIESNAQNLNVNESLTTVQTTAIDANDLPELLKTVEYQSRDGVIYKYEQELQVQPGIQFTHFRDDDLKDEPVIGIKMAKSTPVFNYTLRFLKNAQSDVTTAGRLEDLEDTEMEILGKNYKLLNAYNATNLKLEFMGGSDGDTLEEGGTGSYSIGGVAYDVEVTHIGSTEAKFIINGQTTTSMVEGGTFKLNDGTQVGVRDILYTAKTGQASKVEITLGAEKLTLENSQTVEINDVDVEGLTATITQGNSGSKVTVSDIRIDWVTQDEAFVAAGDSLLFPKLESFKLQMTDLTTPESEEVILKNDGSARMGISWPFKTGSKTIDVLYGNGSEFQGVGKDATHKLVTKEGSGSAITFDEDTDEYFVATYQSETAVESYLLEAKIRQSASVNYTDIKDAVTGEYVCQERQILGTCTIGSVTLTVGASNYADNWVVLTGATDVYFDRMYTEEGMAMFLPMENVTGIHTRYLNTSNLPTSRILEFFEESKDSAVLSVGFNATVGSWTSDGKVQVSSLAGPFANYGTDSQWPEMGDTDDLVAYVASDLGTKLVHNTGGTQDWVSIEYHGEETIGNLWVTAPEVVAGGAQMVKDVGYTDFGTEDVIVVGGPAVNTIASKLLGFDGELTTGPEAGWSVDTFMAKLFTGSEMMDPGTVALLVAGYEAEDTTAAAKYVVAGEALDVEKTKTAATAYY
ncbi:hypothetical protein ACFLZZ_03030 [Nanoarchaeota archaeon]